MRSPARRCLCDEPDSTSPSADVANNMGQTHHVRNHASACSDGILAPYWQLSGWDPVRQSGTVRERSQAATASG